MDNYRILANPSLLADEKVVNIQISFRDKLRGIISHEYNELYIPEDTYNKIINSIHFHINDLVANQIINETINIIIERVIEEHKDKKFDFFIPFD
tara:strand:- start:1142 stop:1426 length:285 start_codon:yes stop_codon:yes gene_type:complete